MHEVVSLLSSSPPQEPSVSYRTANPQSRSLRSNVFNTAFLDIGSSDFEDNGKLQPKAGSRKVAKAIASTLPSPIGSVSNLDSKIFDDSVLDGLRSDGFPVEQPVKRRRLSPRPTTTSTRFQKSLADAEAVFDLSSEPDHDRNPVAKSAADAILQSASLSTYDEVELPSFSSSAPLPKTSATKNVEAELVVDLSSDDGVPYHDPVVSSSQPVPNGKQINLSERTTSLLATLKSSGKHLSVTKSASMRQAGPHFRSTTKKSQVRTPEDDDNIVDSSQPAPKPSKSVKPAKIGENTRQKNTEDRVADKLQKQKEKDAAKEQKRLDKERQAAEKQLTTARAEVNKKKTDKKKTSEEMIVKLPYSVKGKSMGNQIEELMKQVEVEVRYYQADVGMSGDNPVAVSNGTIIKWYRKVNSRYNHELEEYETATSKTEQEKHILVYLTAEEFCALAAMGPTSEVPGQDRQAHPSEEEMKTNLDTYVALIRSQSQGMTLVFLIQGLTAYLKKSANTKNREYAAAVRALNPDTDAPTSSAPTRPSKKRKSTTPQVDLSFLTTEHIDDLTLHLQLSHQPLHIHHTTSVATSAQQIVAFTQHLSTRPYRLSEQAHNLAHASFCMASGQFKTGQGDVTETFLKMLEQVNRITPSMALGIVTEGYDTPRQLVEGFKKVESGGTIILETGSGSSREAREAKEKARLMLQDVRKALNKNGARSDKRLGPAASKRLYKVFMSKDENLRDGIV